MLFLPSLVADYLGRPSRSELKLTYRSFNTANKLLSSSNATLGDEVLSRPQRGQPRWRHPVADLRSRYNRLPGCGILPVCKNPWTLKPHANGW